jgi:peptidoglycan-associated lipoprotein
MSARRVHAMNTLSVRRIAFLLLLLVTMAAGACGKKTPPVARPIPPPPSGSTTVTPPPEPPAPAPEPTTVPPEPVAEDSIAAGSIDDINRNSPLKPVFYGLDVAEVDAEGQKVLQDNADLLRRYATWQISIEGHCDERGTAEYNLALGERRAVAARNYLVSLGIPADRVKTVSYGKEFPFDPGHSEEAWSKNRRAHFVVTAK